MSYLCPVCGYNRLEEEPYDKNGIASSEICPCCGFEFGYDDFSEGHTFESYREKWITEGCQWFDITEMPDNFDILEQLSNLPQLTEKDLKLLIHYGLISDDLKQSLDDSHEMDM